MKIIIIPNGPIMVGRHYSIANELIEKGHEVHYLLWDLPYNIKASALVQHLFTSLLPKQYQYNGFTVYKVGRLPYFWPYVNGWLFKYQVRKLYRKLDADIIFTESFTNETEVPKDLPYIYDLADDYAGPADAYGSFIYKLAFKLLGVRRTMQKQCQNALAVTTVSDVLSKLAEQYNDRVYLVSNGVDGDVISQIKRDESTYLTNQHSMIYGTGFGQWSRHIETMQAVVDLREEFPDVELTLMGGGVEGDKMEKFIRDNNAETYIRYLGPIYNRKEWFTLINQSAIGLNISDKNAWRDAAQPIKVLEYCALGKKVVSTNLAGVMLLGFPNIFIFTDKSDETDLKSAMRHALRDVRNSNDFETISNQVIKDYSWSKSVEELIDIIVVSKSKRTKL